MSKRILVTGTEGYIGAVLAPFLMSKDLEVVGLDTGFYREGWLFTPPGALGAPRQIYKDIRNIETADLVGFDAIVHLAELSNDPLGEHKPEVTFDINHQGSVRLARLAKKAGVPRFVYTSSCSVYGVAEGVVDETSVTDPQTAYASCKVLVEKDVAALADENFSPVFLRNATAYGASPRMRFDIVLNNLSGWAWTEKKIAMTSDGTPWRPLVHISDISNAIYCAIIAPTEAVHAQIFNVGASDANYQVRDIATAVANVFPDCALEFGPPSGDNRSYRVSFDKIHAQLPGYSCAWDLELGARELLNVFSRIQLSSSEFQARSFTRLKALTHLHDSGQVDDQFYWIGQ